MNDKENPRMIRVDKKSSKHSQLVPWKNTNNNLIMFRDEIQETVTSFHLRLWVLNASHASVNLSFQQDTVYEYSMFPCQTFQKFRRHTRTSQLGPTFFPQVDCFFFFFQGDVRSTGPFAIFRASKLGNWQRGVADFKAPNVVKGSVSGNNTIPNKAGRSDSIPWFTWNSHHDGYRSFCPFFYECTTHVLQLIFNSGQTTIEIVVS